MDYTLLSELHLGVQSYTIRTMISRMWEYRGKSDDEPIKHVDLVIIDEKSTSMYVEIPPDAFATLKPHLEEGKVVLIKKFVVQNAKVTFKVVEGPYMIKLNRRTEIMKVDPQPLDFPRYSYRMTLFSDLNNHLNMTDRFLDVIGQITAVSDVVTVKSYGKLQQKRLIKLKDLSDQTIEVSLWGSRATEFNGSSVYEIGQDSPIIALFVGTLWKGYKNETPYLSCTSACRWYINDVNIEDIKNFWGKLPDEVEAVEKLELPTNTGVHDDIKKATLLHLKSIDPFLEKAQRYECTVTITRLSPNQSWNYPACKACSSRSKFNGTTYVCSNEKCPCTQIEHGYKVCLMGSDETYELEFILFDQRAYKIIGKPCERLPALYNRFDTPPKISALIGQKYTFIVNVSPKSIDNEDLSFEVVFVKEQFGKQATIPTVRQSTTANIVPAAPASMISSSKTHLPLIPIKPKNKEIRENFKNLAHLNIADHMDIDKSGAQTDSTSTMNKRSHEDFQQDDDISDDDDKMLSAYRKKPRN